MNHTCYAERPHLDAPEPVLTVDGASAVITDVRYTWWVHCHRCRLTVTLYADGGSIETGIKTDLIGKGARGGGRVKNIPRHRWYHKMRPPATPVVPEHCPLCGHDRWIATGELGWREPWPINAGSQAMSRAYDALRADPQLAEAIAQADEYERNRYARK